MYGNVLGSSVPGGDESEYPLRPCNHEKFDTRLTLHAANAISHEHQRILITSWLPVTWTGGNKIKMVMKNGRCIHSVRNFSVT